MTTPLPCLLLLCFWGHCRHSPCPCSSFSTSVPFFHPLWLPINILPRSVGHQHKRPNGRINILKYVIMQLQYLQLMLQILYTPPCHPVADEAEVEAVTMAPITVAVVPRCPSHLVVLVIEWWWPSTLHQWSLCSMPSLSSAAHHCHHCQTLVPIHGDHPPILLHCISRAEDDPIPPSSFVAIDLCVIKGIDLSSSPLPSSLHVVIVNEERLTLELPLARLPSPANSNPCPSLCNGQCTTDSSW